MRRRKNVKKSDDESDGSDVAEEQEEFADSSEDWTPGAAPVKGAADVVNANEGQPKGRKRPSKSPAAAVNTSKKKRKNSTTEESEPEEEGGEEEGEQDVEEEEDESEEEKNGSDGNKSDSSSKDIPKYYHSGNFVLLKSDVKWSGEKVVSKLEDVNLWKIDGKALLQKYVPMDSNGRTLHKCTCVYSGWNVDNRENYYPVTEILDKNPKTDAKEPCVALDLADLVKVKDKN